MSDMERLTITLTGELVKSVKQAISAGDYASSSEVMREALRDWSRKRTLQQRELDRVRTDLRKGMSDLESGRVSDFNPKEIIAMGEKKSRRNAGRLK